MSEATLSHLSLHRTASTRTIPRSDGHRDGHLNIIATRHGWTRTLSVNPEDVITLDYSTLEAVLELNTLRLRAQHLRIYVESPPHSGQFSKIRYWKNDGSLQSILVKQFFNQRVEEGTVTTLDVRDGSERDDTISIKSGIISGSRLLPGGLSRPGETKAWLKRRVTRTQSNTSGLPGGGDHDSEHPAMSSEPKASRTQALWYFLGLTDEPPAPPPKSEDQIVADAQQEEATLRKSGWVPPVLRRMASRKSQKGSKSGGKPKMVVSNPFFSSSERNLVRRKNKKGGDGSPSGNDENRASTEELQMVDAEDGERPTSKPVQKETKWLRFFSSKNEEPQEHNPFLGVKESKGKGKGKEKQTVQIVGKPTEAFDHSPNTTEVE